MRVPISCTSRLVLAILQTDLVGLVQVEYGPVDISSRYGMILWSAARRCFQAHQLAIEVPAHRRLGHPVSREPYGVPRSFVRFAVVKAHQKRPRRDVTKRNAVLEHQIGRA